MSERILSRCILGVRNSVQVLLEGMSRIFFLVSTLSASVNTQSDPSEEALNSVLLS